MKTLRLPRVRRTVVRMGVAVTMAATLMATGMATSQAADGVGVTSTESVPMYFAGLTPDRAYATSSPYGQGEVLTTTLSAGPTFGNEWSDLLPLRSTFGFSASAARVIAQDISGQTRLYDRGTWVGILPDDFPSGTLSGSWFTTGNTMASLEGTHVDLSPYITDSENKESFVAGQLGSLFLVQANSYGTGTCTTSRSETVSCDRLSSVSLTVRDAANSGKTVGKAISLAPPLGAAITDLTSCSLQPGEIECMWTQTVRSAVTEGFGWRPTSKVTSMWVTRHNLVTGKTTSVSLPLPSEPAFTTAAGTYAQDPRFGDGVVVIDCLYSVETGDDSYRPVDSLYAYDLSAPSQMVHIDGNSIRAIVNNRVAVTVTGANFSSRVVELPFGGSSAPHVIGVMGTKNTVTPAAPLNLELDLTKPLKAGTLSIADPSGTVVATLTTPASTDGSLRGLTWTPPSGVSGTYTWTLTATDSLGQVAVNTVGDGPASGTFTVKAPPCKQFTDVASSNTFAPAICWVSATGITMGTGDGSTYSPSNPVNRGSMAAFLYRLAGSPKWTPPTQSPFVDVKTTDTFYPAITWLENQGITLGTTVNGKVYYQPTNAVNRGSMSAFLYRFSASPKWTLPATSPFTDVASSNTFYKSITWLADQKITVGSTVGGKLVYQPGNPVNRGSMAAFMQRLAKTELQCTRYGNAVGCQRPAGYILPPLMNVFATG